AINEESEARRREEGRQRMEAGERHQRFVEGVIYSGLRNLSSGHEDELKWLFSLSDTQEILKRCEVHGGKVSYISHVSRSGELDEVVQISWPTSARRGLEKLQKKGCAERFSIQMKFSQELVDRWCDQNPQRVQ
ncbi:MAG TPA: hypothetical protein VFZ59_03285, partial [Verrucomicrobiae bacterium]|nr:hypothetical protein [Verrucomicrobiae bacterium]